MSDFNFVYETKEAKSKKFNFRMKASVDERLTQLAQEGVIKSKGDLINKLIEDYLEKLDENNLKS